jgi:hypothetical protein
MANDARRNIWVVTFRSDVANQADKSSDPDVNLLFEI